LVVVEVEDMRVVELEDIELLVMAQVL